MSESEKFDIETIVSHKRDQIKADRDKELLLEIKWVGYTETTWEPFSSIKSDCPEMVKQYMKSNNLEKNREYLKKKKTKQAAEQMSLGMASSMSFKTIGFSETNIVTPPKIMPIKKATKITEALPAKRKYTLKEESN